MSTFASKSAARKDAQKQNLSLGEIEIIFHEKTKTYTWKPAEVKPVEVVEAPVTDEKPITPKAKKANGKRRQRFGPDQVITILADGNPKRKGSASHKIFEFYKNGQTVAESLAAGGRTQDHTWDVDHKFISIQ